MPGVDLVEVIETIYEPRENPLDWQAVVTRALRPLLDPDGLGIGSHRFDMRDPAHPRITDVVLDALAIPRTVPHEMNAAMAPGMRLDMYNGAVASSLTSRGVRDVPEFQQFLQPFGYGDLVALRSDDEPLVGSLFFSPRRRVTTLRSADACVLERIARHVSVAGRLASTQSRASPDAVVSSAGRVEHASGVARERESTEALSEAAKRIEKARGPLRRLAPGEAVAQWRALVNGRWSLVDHFDHDGRRYMVAVANETSARARRPLTKRETDVCALVALGYANKLVAYELGLSTSSIAGYVRTAMTKLGVRTRVELVARWNALPRGRRE